MYNILLTIKKIIKYLYLFYRLIYFLFVNVLAIVVPKKNNLWLIGSWQGNRFSSSSKYLFLYLLKNKPEISVFWITKNKDVFNLLDSQSLPVLYKYSPKGLWCSLRSSVIFVSNEIDDVNPGYANNAIFIQLFHHVLPIKYMMRGDHKVNYNTFKNFSLIRKFKVILNRPHMFRQPDYNVTSSKWMADEVTSKKLNVNKNKILISGFPRTDALLHIQKNDVDYLDSVIDEIKSTNTKVLYYLPTHRDHDLEFNPFDYSFDLEKISNFLIKIDAVLIIRFHPRDKAYRENKYFFENNLRIIKEPEGLQDPYSILKQTDVLITDYGSIFSDYLLMDKPIIFAKFDHEKYVRIRSLNWDYDKYTPGYKTESWTDIIIALNEIFIDKIDIFKVDRNILKNKIYQFQDTNNSKRLIDYIISKI